jgi:hypothetical protein
MEELAIAIVLLGGAYLLFKKKDDDKSSTPEPTTAPKTVKPTLATKLDSEKSEIHVEKITPILNANILTEKPAEQTPAPITETISPNYYEAPSSTRILHPPKERPQSYANSTGTLQIISEDIIN